MLIAFLPSTAQASVDSSCRITAGENVVDTASTTAEVDTAAHEIRLPGQIPNKILGFWDETVDYIVMHGDKVTHYSFDGSRMIENDLVSVNGLTNPVSAATSSPYPDVVVAAEDKVKHYSFTGSGMVSNPSLAVSGLSKVVSVAARESDTAVLTGNQLKYYGLSDSGEMVYIPYLSITSGLNNPIDFSLFRDNYNCVVLEKDRARFFNFTGSSMQEIPGLILSGLNNPVSVSAGGADFAIVEGTQAKRFLFDGSEYTYAAALSVTSGLTSPSCVALRPNSYDMLIADGDEVKYYGFDGTRMQYISDLSVRISGLQDTSYISPAVAQSKPVDIGYSCTRIRVRAYTDLPPETRIDFSVSSDGGSTWYKKARVENTGGGAICYISDDNGTTWTAIGDASQFNPNVNREELWAEVPAGRLICWKAELMDLSGERQATPKIKAPNPGVDAAVVLEVNSKPHMDLQVSGVCYTTMTPTISWNFTDRDGDSQSAFQIQIKRRDTGEIVYDSLKIYSSQTSFKLLTSTDPAVPSAIWQSGQYRFTIVGRVWDALDYSSDPDTADICFIAFEKPRVKEISVPAVGQVSPDPLDPSTHIVITEGMAEGNLPKTKAGGKVTVLIDSIGPISSVSARFPYRDTEAVIGTPPKETASQGVNKRWEMSFWTDASKDICPDGTLIKAEFAGSGGGYTTLNLPPYADGIVTTQGSVFEDWMVVLQGRS